MPSLFTESTCYSCLFEEVIDITTSDGAYAVSLLDTDMSAAQKMVDDQVAATTKKWDTVTLDRSVYDKESDVRNLYAPLKSGETLEFVIVMSLVLPNTFSSSISSFTSLSCQCRCSWNRRC